MSIAFEEPLFNYREQEAKQLFGLAVSKAPENLYAALGAPAPSKLPDTARDSISAEYARKYGRESDAQDLLLVGIAETQTYVLGSMQHHPNIPFERAVAIVQHERTTRGLALIARQSSENTTKYLRHPGDAYDLSADRVAIEVDASITPALVRGCPAIEVVNGDVMPWPIFSRFAPWAAKLALLSYYDHRED